MAAKHNEAITLYHPEHGTKHLTRKQFNEYYGLSKQDTSDLVNRRGKIRQGWSLPKQESWKSFYISVSQEVWNIAEKVAYEKGLPIEAVVSNAAEEQLKSQVTKILLESIE